MVRHPFLGEENPRERGTYQSVTSTKGRGDLRGVGVPVGHSHQVEGDRDPFLRGGTREGYNALPTLKQTCAKIGEHSQC